jgi:hypothetical protein
MRQVPALVAVLIPNAVWLQVLFVGGLTVIAGFSLHLAYKALRRRRHRRHPDVSSPRLDRLERGGAGLVGAAVCVAALVVYFVGFHVDTTPLGKPLVIGGLPAHSTYLGLGDSYAAGEGQPPFQSGTATNGCHRSESNAFEDLLTFDTPITAAFNACSGATIGDIAGNAPGLPRGRPNDRLQVDGTPASGISLATIIISANDAYWPSVLVFCAEHVYCPNNVYANGQPLQTWATHQIGLITHNLDGLFHTLRTRVQGRILVLGYPQLFPLGPPSFFAPGNCKTFDSIAGWSDAERQWFHDRETELDTGINRSATNAGLDFVATDVVFAGHETCGTKGEWINFVTAGDFNAIKHGDISKIVGSGSFHPTRIGQQALARIISCYLYEHRHRPEPVNGASTAGGATDPKLTDLTQCVDTNVAAVSSPTAKT